MPLDVRRVRDRKVAQWGLAYVGAAWLALQLADVLQAPFSIGAGAIQLLVVMLALGLPVVLVLAWYHGDRGRQRVSGAELIIIGALLAIAGTVLNATINPLEGPTGADLGQRSDSRTPTDRRSVAVLPFANLSPDPEHAYFADGIHDEVISRLSKIPTLRVVSRTSVMRFREPDRDLPAIGEELQVGSILEATVRRAGDRVRITAQLIDASLDDHLWSEIFERALTTENIFAIQAEIAAHVARALEAELSPSLARDLADRATEDLEAYDWFLRGAAVRFAGYQESDLRYKIHAYEMAVALDPTFAVAWAALSVANADLHWFVEPTPARARATEEALDRALELAPRDGETRLAAAVHYYRIRRDYGRALTELQAAGEALPFDARVEHLVAAILRRLGQWDESLDHFARALRLEPRSAAHAMELGITFWLMRRYEEAEVNLRQALEWDPAFFLAAVHLALARFGRDGDPQAALSVIEATALAGVPPSEHPHAQNVRIQLLLFGEREAEALEILELETRDVLEWQHFAIPASLLRGQIFMLKGESKRGRAEVLLALRLLEARLQQSPEDPRFHAALALTLAELGRATEAVLHAEHAAALLPVTQDSWIGSYYLENLAYTHARVGNTAHALTLFEDLLTRPGPTSLNQLRLDPRLRELRGQIVQSMAR